MRLKQKGIWIWDINRKRYYCEKETEGDMNKKKETLGDYDFDNRNRRSYDYEK